MPVFDYAIAALTLGFIAYFFLSFSPAVLERWRARGERAYAYYLVLYQRYMGVLCLGVLPAAGLWFLNKSPLDYGFQSGMTAYDFMWIGGTALLILPINYFNARKPDNLAMYPQIRLKEWSWAVVLHNAMSWVAYLLAYEWLFRGLFLMSAAAVLPMWTAILLTTSLYAIAHIPKGLKETVGAMPLGVLLGYLTLQTNTLWIAWGIHVVLALSNSYLSLYYQPDMRLKR
jgi:membrane protease YdiL (CAAX protease family)